MLESLSLMHIVLFSFAVSTPVWSLSHTRFNLTATTPCPLLEGILQFLQLRCHVVFLWLILLHLWTFLVLKIVCQKALYKCLQRKHGLLFLLPIDRWKCWKCSIHCKWIHETYSLMNNYYQLNDDWHLLWEADNSNGDVFDISCHLHDHDSFYIKYLLVFCYHPFELISSASTNMD